MYRLTPHEQAPAVGLSGIDVMWMELGGGRHQLTWGFRNAARLLLPRRESRERGDNLWQMTCGELFLRRQAGPAYYEFNFSPSMRWSAWGFTEYREGRSDWQMDRPPHVEGFFRGEDFMLQADISGLPEGMTVASISAVAVERSLPEPPPEGEDGPADPDDAPWRPVTSLWATWHPAAQPDFHHPSSYSLPLAPWFR